MINQTTIEVLFQRRVPIEYVSAPACDVVFSSSSEPVIVLEPIYRPGSPTGLYWVGGSGGFRIGWDAYPGAVCYSIYKNDSMDDSNPCGGTYVLVAECVPDTYYTVGPTRGCYRITVITGEGESELSEPIITPDPYVPCNCPLSFDTDDLPDACYDEIYDQQLQASGGITFLDGGYAWELDLGPLPPGLALDMDTGVINGITTTTGVYPVTFSVSDFTGQIQTKSFTITVIEISTTTLPSAIVGEDYTATLATDPPVVGGVWALHSGTMPDGLSIVDDEIVGEPDPGSNGDYTFSVSFTYGDLVCVEDLTLKVWDSDNTPMGQFAAIDDGGTLYTYNGGTSLGIGKYKVVYLNNNWRALEQWTGQRIEVAGGGEDTIPPIIMSATGPLPGAYGIAANQPDARTNANDKMDLLEPLAIFEFFAPTVVTYSWAAKFSAAIPATIGGWGYNDGGGTSPTYNIIRIGKP